MKAPSSEPQVFEQSFLPTHSIACRLPLTVRLLNCFPVLQFVISSTTSKHLPWHPNQARNLLSLVFS